MADDTSEATLEMVLANYLRAVDAGEDVDEAALLRQHPDLADELGSFFRNRQAMQRMAAPMLDADIATLGLAVEPPAAAGHVRYFGDYELVDELARGGMGVIYRARQVSLNRIVALKMILTGQLASASDVRRFRQEAEAAANLDHPHIVPIYEVGEHEGQHYYSMKLIDGPSLSAAIRSRPGVPPPRAAVRLMADVSRAVHHAHQRGVLHRDLKPGNILLDAAGQPHVTDFGLAKRVQDQSDLTQSGAILGTPSYMPPEQARGERQLTTAADVYSLGAILFELLTGQPPFKADSVAATLLRVLSDEAPSPSSINRAIDRDLETIVNRCLLRDPARRYDSAAALADDLDRWLAGEPILARRIGTWERAVKWARRHPGRALLAAVSLLSVLALLIAFATGFYLVRQEQQRTLAERNKTRRANAELLSQQAETRAAHDRLRHVSYAQSLALVRAEYEANNVARAIRLLEETPAELRHWEWDYLEKLCHGEARNLMVPRGHLRSVAFRPDGSQLVAGGGDIGFGPFLGTQELHFWDTAGYEQLPAFHGEGKPPYGAITRVAWSPDGQRLALALWCMTDARDVVIAGGRIDESEAGQVEIWDVRQKKRLHQLRQHHSFVNDVAWSADGSLLASASSDRTVNVWDAATGERKFQLTGHQGQVMCVAFDRAGTLLATGSQGPLTDFGSTTPNDMGELKLWDLATGRERLALAGHELGTFAVAFSPDGATLASASRDGTVKLWRAADGTLIRTLFGHAGSVQHVAFSPDGQRLASASSDRTARIWRVDDGKPLSVLRGHTLEVNALAFHPAGRYLVTCAEQYRSRAPEIKLWDLEDLPEVVECGNVADQPRLNALSADGQLVATARPKQGGQHHEVRVFDASSGADLVALAGDIGYPDEMRFAPDGKLVALYHGPTVAWRTFDIRGAQPARAVAERTFPQYEPPTGFSLRSVEPALTRDGSLLATYHVATESVVVSDAREGRELWRASHESLHGLDLYWSADQSTLVAINSDRIPLDPSQPDELTWRTTSVRAWERASGQEKFAATPRDFDGAECAVSGSGRFVVLANDDAPGLRMWDLSERTEVPWPALASLNCLHLAFSPDETRLVTVHHENSRLTMHVWNLPNRKLISTLNDFSPDAQGPYYSGNVRFSADGRRLFTSGDGTIKVWDPGQGTLLLTLRPGFEPLALSADGRTLAAAGPQGSTRVWSIGDAPGAAADR
ncbi:MAG: protein kinase [Pirellulaceae bacterium]|nr:protein kinase [Pirellulaceae bacterium]